MDKNPMIAKKAPPFVEVKARFPGSCQPTATFLRAARPVHARLQTPVREHQTDPIPARGLWHWLRTASVEEDRQNSQRRSPEKTLLLAHSEFWNGRLKLFVTS
jgi:hypothetical protein